jgi:ribonuclease VapC
VLVAIAVEEAEAKALKQSILSAPEVFVGWPTLVETWTVLVRRMPLANVDSFIDDLRFQGVVTPVGFNSEHYDFARDAYKRFRLGGHPARLNYGDAMSYALARVLDLPLLFKGADFGLTDVKIHPASVQA